MNLNEILKTTVTYDNIIGVVKGGGGGQTD